MRPISKCFLSVMAVQLFFLLSCTPVRREVVVVNYSTFDIAVENGWHLQTADTNTALNDTSIRRMSALILPYSVINRLDYRQLNALRRYCEAGAGGIVGVRDTIIMQPDCPWIKTWNNKSNSTEETEGLARLYIITGNDPSEWKKALKYTVGENRIPDYSIVRTLVVPDSKQFKHSILADGLNEPMQMVILPGNDVLIAERKGQIRLYKEEEKALRTVANFQVFSGIEDGLLGVCADPGFERNHFLYFFYSVPGESPVNRLSRIKFFNDSLDRSSEKVLLDIPMQRKYCCHSAGYLAFDAKGNLYISTGDNTNAEETEGYTPVDERPGRELSDDQATAANSNDLRGKILRIRPEPGGTYSIPDGNLFPKDGSQGRPEVFVMGCRNPFRISIDRQKGHVYWGDVGPDTKVKGPDGLMSFDEINQAKQAGFFGWPYFLGNNQVFPHYNYASKTTSAGKDPLRPMNLSPNNTGIKQLPPAQPAMIWYNKSASERFPLTGKGGASAMAGPVYYNQQFKDATYKLPSYYDGKLFIYDWVRRWIRAVSFDENGDFACMEPFLDEFTFASPIDMQLSADGAMYILEYGSHGFTKNADAKLSRIEYHEGNPPPSAVISIDRQHGGVPLTVKLSASKSMTYTRSKKISYKWVIGKKTFHTPELLHTFVTTGIHQIILVVTDADGKDATARQHVYVGNTPPHVRIETNSNRSFYFPGEVFDYRIRITDPDEPAIDPSRAEIDFGFIPHGNDAAVILASGKKIPSTIALAGEKLMQALDCKSCHRLHEHSTGPAYVSIARRYRDSSGAARRLAEKIINGGSGNWGDRPMSAHPDLTLNQAEQITRYILSLSDQTSSRGFEGALKLQLHDRNIEEGVYLLTAGYADRGANGIPSLHARDHIVLRAPVLQAEAFAEGNVSINTITTMFFSYVYGITDGKYIAFRDIDLTRIKEVAYRVQHSGRGGDIELRLDSISGPVMAKTKVSPGKDDDPRTGWKVVSTSISPVVGAHHLYFVFTNTSAEKQTLFTLDEIRFSTVQK